MVHRKLLFTLLFTSLNLIQIAIVFSLPESGRWTQELNDAEESLLSFQKSLTKGSDILVNVHCKKEVILHVNWRLLTSPCLEEFAYVNSSELLRSPPQFSAIATKMALVQVSNRAVLTCHPSIPVSLTDSSLQNMSSHDSEALLPTASVDGAYLLLIGIKCVSRTACRSQLIINVEMKDRNGGYLSAVERPLLPFFGCMSIVYGILAFAWLTIYARFWPSLLRIQFCIGLVILIGLLEQLLIFAQYEQLHHFGQVATAVSYLAELVTCVKRTFARLLLMIVCLGYGVTKSRLGLVFFRRIFVIILLYFVFVTMESLLRISKPRFAVTLLLFIFVVPVAVLDLIILWWCFLHLIRTLRETRIRRHVCKHRLYRIFSNLLLVTGLVSLAFMTWSLFMFKWTPCITAFRYLWLDEAFWQMLFAALLCCIIWLWRPTDQNRQYAYSILDSRPAGHGGLLIGNKQTGDTIIDDEEEEEELEEHVLMDREELLSQHRVTSHDRLRESTDIIASDNASATKLPKASATLMKPHDGMKPIPATVIERFGIEAISGPNPASVVWKVD